MFDRHVNRSRLKLLALLAAPLAAVAGGLTYAHQHRGSGHGCCGGGGDHHAEAHLSRLADMLGKIGVSESQRVQIDAILRPAFANMKAAHDSHDAALGQFHELLLSPTVDRVRIESMRAEQFRQLDQATQEMAKAFVDAAEVLTPEQRTALAAEVRRHHGG